MTPGWVIDWYGPYYGVPNCWEREENTEVLFPSIRLAFVIAGSRLIDAEWGMLGSIEDAADWEIYRYRYGSGDGRFVRYRDGRYACLVRWSEEEPVRIIHRDDLTPDSD